MAIKTSTIAPAFIFFTSYLYIFMLYLHSGLFLEEVTATGHLVSGGLLQ